MAKVKLNLNLEILPLLTPKGGEGRGEEGRLYWITPFHERFGRADLPVRRKPFMVPMRAGFCVAALPEPLFR